MTNTNNQQPRVQPGSPTGGQFAAHQRADSDIILARDAPATTITGVLTFQIPDFSHEPLPAWPDDLDEKPEVSWGYNDNGVLETYLEIGDDSFTFWHEWGENGDNIDDRDWNGIEREFTDEQLDAIREYGRAVHKRTEYLAGCAEESVRQRFGSGLDAALTGADPATVRELTTGVPEYTGDNDLARSATQGEQAATLWGDEDENGTHVADTLANLMIYAKSKGWDFDELTRRASGYAEDALSAG